MSIINNLFIHSINLFKFELLAEYHIKPVQIVFLATLLSKLGKKPFKGI